MRSPSDMVCYFLEWRYLNYEMIVVISLTLDTMAKNGEHVALYHTRVQSRVMDNANYLAAFY